MRTRALIVGVAATAIAAGLGSAAGTASAAPGATGISCQPSPSVGQPSTAGGLFGTAPLTFPAQLVAGWQLSTGRSAGATTTAAARYTNKGGVLNLVEVGRLGIVENSHDTVAMAHLFSVCRFQLGRRFEESKQTVQDRKVTPVRISGTTGTRLDLNVVSPADPATGDAAETDWFTIITLDTKPPTYFLGGANKANADARAKVDAVIRTLRLR